MKKILIIDNDSESRQTTINSLRRSGYEVLEISHGLRDWKSIHEFIASLDGHIRPHEKTPNNIIAIKNLILENSALGVALVRHRRFVWSNRRLAELLGIRLESILSTSTRVIYPSDEAFEKFGAEIYPTMRNGGCAEADLELCKSGGTHFWCRFIGKALNAEDPDAGSVWMFEDITAHKHLAAGTYPEKYDFAQAQFAIPAKD